MKAETPGAGREASARLPIRLWIPWRMLLDSVAPIDSILVLLDQLQGHVQALQGTVNQNAEAEAIDRAVSRCAETFVLLKGLLSSLPVGWGHHEEARRNRAQALLTELLGSYEACMKTLATASARTVQELAGMRKSRSVSQQYQKIAHLV